MDPHAELRITGVGGKSSPRKRGLSDQETRGRARMISRISPIAAGRRSARKGHRSPSSEAYLPRQFDTLDTREPYSMIRLISVLDFAQSRHNFPAASYSRDLILSSSLLSSSMLTRIKHSDFAPAVLGLDPQLRLTRRFSLSRT